MAMIASSICSMGAKLRNSFELCKYVRACVRVGVGACVA